MTPRERLAELDAMTRTLPARAYALARQLTRALDIALTDRKIR